MNNISKITFNGYCLDNLFQDAEIEKLAEAHRNFFLYNLLFEVLSISSNVQTYI